MSDSLSNWLALRETADTDARSQRLTNDVVVAIGRHDPLSLLDLGTGTGSNIRYLAERLPAPQRWLAVDRDAALLAALPERITSWAAASGYDAWTDDRRCDVRGAHLRFEIETYQGDLGTLDDPRIF